MNKIKTIHAVVKRIKKTSTGKIKFKKANSRHMLTKKTSKKKRKLRFKKKLNKSNIRLLKNCIPYI